MQCRHCGLSVLHVTVTGIRLYCTEGLAKDPQPESDKIWFSNSFETLHNNGLTLTEMQFAVLSPMRSGVQFVILLEW
jgi:hypothetical protein